MQPKKSGETIEDVIEYVHRGMYRQQQKEKKPSDSSEEESESEEVEIAPPPSNNETNTPSSPSIDNTPSSPSNVATKDSTLDSSNSDDESKSDEENDEDSTDVPPEYLFPSFFVFVLYGPFVPPSDQLNSSVIDNKNKNKIEGTREEMRKKDANEKAIDAKNDSTSTHSFKTDQRIDIESLSMQKETMVDR